MDRLSLTAKAREESGKGHARRMRKAGYVPAILYGPNREATPIKVKAQELYSSLASNAIIDLTIEGEESQDKAVVMLKDLQRDILKGFLVHADFHEISLDETMVVSVSIELEGTPAGVKEGGVLSQLLREVEVECLPTNIPSQLTLDVSALEIGDSLEVGELDLPEGVDFITPTDETVVTVIVPTAEIEEEEEEELEDVDAEPELIGAEDEDEEGEEEEEDKE